jgi:hypothetical protein
MPPAALNALARAQPFAQFYLHMADNVRYQVTRPEAVFVGAESAAIYYLDDSWVQLDIRLITAMGPTLPVPLKT